MQAQGTSVDAFFLETLKSSSSSWLIVVAGESMGNVSLFLDHEGGGVVEC
jgi:hypothetical protein